MQRQKIYNPVKNGAVFFSRADVVRIYAQRTEEGLDPTNPSDKFRFRDFKEVDSKAREAAAETAEIVKNIESIPPPPEDEEPKNVRTNGISAEFPGHSLELAIR